MTINGYHPVQAKQSAESSQKTQKPIHPLSAEALTNIGSRALHTEETTKNNLWYLIESLPQSWRNKLTTPLLNLEDEADRLVRFLRRERRLYDIYPKVRCTFKALELTAFDAVKVVILGQDPYHTPHVANGLAFSTMDLDYLPPSLANIYKELKSDIGKNHHIWGEYHAQQGVLLLNTALTVREKAPNSHSKLWKFFTSCILRELVDNPNPKVFMLWGKQAVDYLANACKEQFINKILNGRFDQNDQQMGLNFDAEFDTEANNLPIYQHLFLKAAHPSPLSAHRGFFGCRHFSKCNEFLQQNGLPAIDW